MQNVLVIFGDLRDPVCVDTNTVTTHPYLRAQILIIDNLCYQLQLGLHWHKGPGYTLQEGRPSQADFLAIQAKGAIGGLPAVGGFSGREILHEGQPVSVLHGLLVITTAGPQWSAVSTQICTGHPVDPGNILSDEGWNPLRTCFYFSMVGQVHNLLVRHQGQGLTVCQSANFIPS